MLEEKHKRIIKAVLKEMRGNIEEDMEVGESYILMSGDLESEREIRKCVDEIDNLISECDLDGRMVAVSQKPPTVREIDLDTKEESLQRARGDVGVGFERIN